MKRLYHDVETKSERSRATSGLQTRSALLNAAERLFAQRGVDGVSIRDIISEAKANLGAINYHFGSKDHLVLAVFKRRLEPLNRARIERLTLLEKSAGGTPALTVPQIVDAFVRPSLESESGSEDAAARTGLLNRCFLEPNPALKKFVEEQFAEVVTRFDSAFLSAVPGLSRGELFWRMTFLIGALHHSHEIWMRFDQLPFPQLAERDARPDREGLIQRLIAFVAAGMNANLEIN